MNSFMKDLDFVINQKNVKLLNLMASMSQSHIFVIQHAIKKLRKYDSHFYITIERHSCSAHKDEIIVGDYKVHRLEKIGSFAPQIAAKTAA